MVNLHWWFSLIRQIFYLEIKIDIKIDRWGFDSVSLLIIWISVGLALGYSLFLSILGGHSSGRCFGFIGSLLWCFEGAAFIAFILFGLVSCILFAGFGRRLWDRYFIALGWSKKDNFQYFSTFLLPLFSIPKLPFSIYVLYDYFVHFDNSSSSNISPFNSSPK